MGESCQRKLIRLTDCLRNKTVKSCLKIKKEIKKKIIKRWLRRFSDNFRNLPTKVLLVFCCRCLKYEMETRNKVQKRLILDTNMSFVMFSVVSAFENWHGQKTCSKNICLLNMSSAKKNLLKS